MTILTLQQYQLTDLYGRGGDEGRTLATGGLIGLSGTLSLLSEGCPRNSSKISPAGVDNVVRTFGGDTAPLFDRAGLTGEAFGLLSVVV